MTVKNLLDLWQVNAVISIHPRISVGVRVFSNAAFLAIKILIDKVTLSFNYI
jgi:hypothetical protein